MAECAFGNPMDGSEQIKQGVRKLQEATKSHKELQRAAKSCKEPQTALD